MFFCHFQSHSYNSCPYPTFGKCRPASFSFSPYFLDIRTQFFDIRGIFTFIPYQLLRFCSIWIYNTIQKLGEKFGVCEPTSRAASRSTEADIVGNSTSVEWGRKRSEVRVKKLGRQSQESPIVIGQTVLATPSFRGRASEGVREGVNRSEVGVGIWRKRGQKSEE